MNTKEHLEKIKAKCQELLAIAEKRTAEAGWRVTITQATFLLKMADRHHDIETCKDLFDMQEQLVAAWPEELLN